MATSMIRKWTVFFVIKSVDNLPLVITMLTQLMGIKFPDTVAIVFCVNFDGNHRKALLKLDLSHLDTSGRKPEFTTIFLTILRDASGKNVLKDFDEKANFNITEEDDLATFFRKNVINRYRARKYLLFTWDHGNGFGIFSGHSQGSSDNKRITLSFNDDEIPVLTMYELSQAIRWSMGRKKIPLLIMMNCSMQVIDTGYALRNNVKYLVAPQTLMGFTDYDYEAMLRMLAGKPGITPRKLAAFVIESFRAKTIREGTNINESISACRLRYVGITIRLMNRLARSLSKRLPGEFELFRKVFREARSVNDGISMIDLYSLFDELRTIATLRQKILISYLLWLRKLVVYRKYIGPDLDSSPAKKYFGHNGVSILTPMRRPLPSFMIPEKIENFYMDTSFEKDTAWGEFISELRRLEEATPE